MAKKIHTVKQHEELQMYQLEGDIDSAIEHLKLVKEQILKNTDGLATNIHISDECHWDHFEYRVNWERPENDKEKKRREAAAKKRRDRKKAADLKQQNAELKMLEKLKDKYPEHA